MIQANFTVTHRCDVPFDDDLATGDIRECRSKSFIVADRHTWGAGGDRVIRRRPGTQIAPPVTAGQPTAHHHQSPIQLVQPAGELGGTHSQGLFRANRLTAGRKQQEGESYHSLATNAS